MNRNSSTVTIRTRRPGAVFICGKCLKRCESGGKLKRRLKKQLANVSHSLHGKRPKLVVTTCLGVYPKNAVVAASATTLGRGEVVLLRDSKVASIEMTMAALTL